MRALVGSSGCCHVKIEPVKRKIGRDDITAYAVPSTVTPVTRTCVSQKSASHPPAHDWACIADQQLNTIPQLRLTCMQSCKMPIVAWVAVAAVIGDDCPHLASSRVPGVADQIYLPLAFGVMLRVSVYGDRVVGSCVHAVVVHELRKT